MELEVEVGTAGNQENSEEDKEEPCRACLRAGVMFAGTEMSISKKMQSEFDCRPVPKPNPKGWASGASGFKRFRFTERYE